MPQSPTLDIFKDNSVQNLTTGSSFTPNDTSETPAQIASPSQFSGSPDQNKNLEMAYLLSSLSSKGPNPVVGKMLEFTRQQRAVEGISVAINNAQEAINQNDYPRARTVLQDSIKAATLVAPEYLKFLVPQFQAVQQQELTHRGNIAVYNDMLNKAKAMFLRADQATDPTEKKFVQAQATGLIQAGEAYINSKGITPELMAKMVEKSYPETRPAPEQGAYYQFTPQGETFTQQGQLPLGEGSVSKEQGMALGSLGLTPNTLINSLRSENPEVKSLATALYKLTAQMGSHASLVQQLGAENLPYVQKLYGSPESLMYGPQGQQLSPQLGTQPQTQRPNVPSLLKKGQAPVQVSPGQVSQGPTPYLWPSGQPNPEYTTNTIPGMKAEDVAKGKALQEKAVEQTTPSGHPESQQGLNIKTGEFVPVNQIPLGTPDIVRVPGKDADKARAASDVLTKITTYENTVKEVAQRTGWSGPLNTVQHFLTNTSWLPGRFDEWQKLTQAHQDMDRAWQLFENTAGIKSSETSAVRKSLNSFSTSLPMVEEGIAQMRKSIQGTMQSLVGNQEPVEKKIVPIPQPKTRPSTPSTKGSSKPGFTDADFGRPVFK